MLKHFRDEMQMIGKHGRPVGMKEDHFWIRILRAIWVCYMYEETSVWDYQGGKNLSRSPIQKNTKGSQQLTVSTPTESSTHQGYSRIPLTYHSAVLSQFAFSLKKQDQVMSWISGLYFPHLWIPGGTILSSDFRHRHGHCGAIK